MKGLYFFGYYLNGLEFVTYVIIPSAILLVTLVYIYFNLKIFRLSMNLNDISKQKILTEIFENEYEPKKINLIIFNKFDENNENK